MRIKSPKTVPSTRPIHTATTSEDGTDLEKKFFICITSLWYYTIIMLLVNPPGGRFSSGSAPVSG
jgi:hypothetical protein